MLHATDGLIHRWPARQPSSMPIGAGSRIYRWDHMPSKEISIRTSVVKGGPYLLVFFERVDIINGGTRNSAWSPAWYHAGVVCGHAAMQVAGSTPVELNYI